MDSNPLISTAQDVFVGGLLGVLGALAGQYVLLWLRLRWTWALFPMLAGGVLAWATVIETWSVALTVGGLVTARWAFTLERRAREAGGDQRRAAKEIVGPTDVVAKRRSLKTVREGQLIDGNRFLLGYGTKHRPVSLRFGTRSGRHGLMLGASGSGKTNALLCCLACHIEAGFGCVVIDMKGDQLLARRLRHLAERADVDYNQWSLDGCDYWNPLARGNRSELKDKLIASEEFSERHYQAMYERYLLNLFRALEDKPEDRHLRTVVRLLDPNELAMYIRNIDDDTAEEISGYLQRLTGDQVKDLRGLADRLALLVEGDHGDRLIPSEDGDDIDLLQVLREGSVVVFSLNSSSQPATAKLIANMAIQDLKATCGTIESDGALPRPAVVAIDEFAGIDGDQVAGLFQRARSAGLSVMLATQELADLRRVDEGFDEQIVGNVEWILAGRQNNPTSAETVAGLAGTEEVWVHTFQTDDIALRGQGPFGRESGMGTKHRGREFVVSPDEIKALPVGRMLLIEKNPHHTELVDVLPADRQTPDDRKAA